MKITEAQLRCIIRQEIKGSKKSIREGSAPPNSVSKVASLINSVLFSDSHITVDVKELEAALNADKEVVGRFPTEGEVDDIVMGGDDGLKASMFPTVSNLLASQF